MENEKKILDFFGEKVIKYAFDPGIGNLKSLRNIDNPPLIFENYVQLFKKLENDEYEILKSYLRESFGDFLFNMLRVFEENPEFKIIYEKDGTKLNLVEISEMLKAEPIIQNGWIDRFSNE